MEPLTLAICDDLPEERDKLISMLELCPFPTRITQFESGEELLKSFQPDSFDLLLMDIYLDGINGVETVRSIRAVDAEIPIAFITTSTEYTLESYRLSVLKYLEKPVRQADLNDLLWFAKLHKESAPRLAIQLNGRTQRIPLSRIAFLEQKAHNVLLTLSSGDTLALYGKLSALLPQLDGHFFFCPHKSYCVNLAFVTGINAEYQCYQMADGRYIPISRPNRAGAKKAYEDFLFATTRRLP